MSSFSIAGCEIGPGHPPFIIAEVGINHNGCLETAKKMVLAAKDAGVNAVKFQTFKAEEFCGDPDQLFTYQSQGESVTESMLEMFKRYEFPKKDWIAIKQFCDENDITFFSTPQNISDLNLLQEIGVPALKVGSDDFTNIPLLEHYAQAGLPLIISCGMSNLGEVDQALEAAGWHDGKQVALLLCTSQYPTPPEDVHILKLNTLKHAFPGLVLGFSDHSKDEVAAIMAVAQGGHIFEKHFTLDRDMPGPDHWFSENPESLKCWVGAIHRAHTSLGSPIVKATEKEEEMKILARRSIVALRDIEAGETLDESAIGLRRPGGGLPPIMLKEVLGLKASRHIKRGNKLSLGDI